jgi:hypothetical protein
MPYFVTLLLPVITNYIDFLIRSWLRGRYFFNSEKPLFLKNSRFHNLALGGSDL